MAWQRKRKISMMADWSDLPQELVISISNRIGVMEDFIAFGAVCKSWRSVAIKENFTGRLTHQVPLLMLPTDAANIRSIIPEFYSLRKEKIRKLNRLEAGAKLCGSLGWLMIYRDSKYNLLNPFSHAQIELPQHLDSERTPFYHEVHKFVLSSNPFCTSDYIIMVLYSENRLAFCKPRSDKYWTSIDLAEEATDITYYKGQLYVMTYCGSVLVCDIKDPNQAHARIVVPQMPSKLLDHLHLHKNRYVVESAGDLLAVFHHHHHHQETEKPPASFKVFKVPFDEGNWRLNLEVKDLGNRTLFVGYGSSSFSIEALNYPGCRANCIYFFSYKYPARDCMKLLRSKENIDVGIFDMKDGEIEQHFGSSCFAFRERTFPTYGTPCLWI